MTEGGIGRALPATSRVHGIRLQRLRLHGADRMYDVDFRTPDGSARPLSVIAGAFSTGKTTILEFIDYCLGASDHPRHPEITPKIRAATLEVALSGTPYLIERAVGEPSTFASVRAGRMDDHGGPPWERRPLRPAGHPDSLSSLLLSHCKLEGVRLREELAGDVPDTDPLSFRDLMALCFLPNDRLDNKNLLFEHNPIKQLKLRQVVDVVFDVHDDRSLDLGRRVREIEDDLAAARLEYEAARRFVDEQQLGDRADLEAVHQRAKATLVEAERDLAALDEQARAATGFAAGLRERHHSSAVTAQRSTAVLRDRETQLQRMTTLRAQYADDVAKLTMLAEAQLLFDPLRVRTCPACLSTLAWSPAVNDGRCSMCHSELDAGGPAAVPASVPAAVPASVPASVPAAMPADARPGAAADGAVDVASEIRAAKARLAEVTGSLEELERSVPGLRLALERAQQEEASAAAAVDTATAHAVTPYLAQRDALARRREDASVAMQRAVSGLQLIQALDRRADDLARKESLARSLREDLEAQASSRVRADRSAVITLASERYRAILAAWRYPKLADAYLADDLTPFVRGNRYTASSPGGRTLISLAWQLALFEIAWEAGSSHPGFLLLDSPQKNLGQAGERDAEFADTVTIADIYRHLRRWLAGRGAGAQVVVADNAPPPEADADVIVRFSRRPDQPPYGLIDDETG
jgi:hypothetical protein